MAPICEIDAESFVAAGAHPALPGGDGGQDRCCLAADHGLKTGPAQRWRRAGCRSGECADECAQQGPRSACVVIFGGMGTAGTCMYVMIGTSTTIVHAIVHAVSAVAKFFAQAETSTLHQHIHLINTSLVGHLSPTIGSGELFSGATIVPTTVNIEECACTR